MNKEALEKKVIYAQATVAKKQAIVQKHKDKLDKMIAAGASELDKITPPQAHGFNRG